MDSKVRLILNVIGALSIISGIYLFAIGSEFLDYFFAFLIGIVLLGSAFFNKRQSSGQ